MGDRHGKFITSTEKSMSSLSGRFEPCGEPEAESNEKHGVWDPMPELTLTSPYVHSRVDSNTFTMALAPLCQSLYLNLMPESTLFPSQGLGIWPLVLL